MGGRRTTMRLASAGRWLLELLGGFIRRFMERASADNSVQTRLKVPPQEFRRCQTGHLLNNQRSDRGARHGGLSVVERQGPEAGGREQTS